MLVSHQLWGFLAGVTVGAVIGIGSVLLARPLGFGTYLLNLVEDAKHKRTLARRPKRIILIRHGESVGNVKKSIYADVPDNQIPLTDKGKQQALEAGQKIRDIVGSERVTFFVSPFLRSRQTFEQIATSFARASYCVREDPRLREQGTCRPVLNQWGNFQDPDSQPKVIEERTRVGRFYYRFPTGESGADVYDRATAVWDSLLRFMGSEESTPNIVIVSHGLTLRLMLMRYFRWSVERFEATENLGNCEVVVLERCPGSGSYQLRQPLRADSSLFGVSLQSRYPSLPAIRRPDGPYPAAAGPSA